MALNPRFAAHRVGNPGGHTIDLWVDYVCPWSKIMIDKLVKVAPYHTFVDLFRISFRLLRKTFQIFPSFSVIKFSHGIPRLLWYMKLLSQSNESIPPSSGLLRRHCTPNRLGITIPRLQQSLDWTLTNVSQNWLKIALASLPRRF